MRKIKNKIFIKGIMVFCVFLVSCSLEKYQCPYVITEKKIVTEALENYYDLAGAYITIYNNSEKNIKSLCLQFSLFDENGNPAGNIYNTVSADFTGIIESHSSKQVIVSLDSIIGNLKKRDYEIGFVYLKSITYTDGTIWNDIAGLYSLTI